MSLETSRELASLVTLASGCGWTDDPAVIRPTDATQDPPAT